MKEKEVEVCKSIMVGGMMAAMVSSAVSEGSEQVSESVTPLIAVLASDTAVAHGMMEDGTMQGMLTLAKQHHLNESIVHDTTTAIGLVVQDISHISAIVEWGSAEVLVDSLLTHHADLRRTQETLAVIHTLSATKTAVPSFLSMDSISRHTRDHEGLLHTTRHTHTGHAVPGSSPHQRRGSGGGGAAQWLQSTSQGHERALHTGGSV